MGMEAQQAVVPPFLSKCYEMVDDPSTDAVVSWGPAGNSFVIWDPHSFGRDLLPKYFKHSNLSSFVRQLNTYGFRKIDPDRYEFANEGFLKGQRDLLRTIIRRKPAQSSSQVQQSQGKNTSGKACLELGKFGLEEEIERLKRDKDLLLKELVKLRHHQQNTDHQLYNLRQSLHGMEQNQQQMLSFLAMAVQSPGFFAQFVQQNENNKRRVEANKKRRLPALEQSVMDGLEACSDGQIIKYQPLTQLNPQCFEPCVTEVSSPSLMQESSVGASDNLKPMSNGISDLCINVDGLSIGMDPSASAEEIFSPDYLDIIEQLLYSPVPENIEQIEPQTLENFILDFNFPQKEIQMEALEKTDGPSEQIGGSNLAPDVPDMHNQS